MGIVTYTFGYVGNSLFLLWLELNVLFEDPFQIINPFLQLQLFLKWITSPLFWQLVSITIIGLALYVIGKWVTEKVSPQSGTLAWYWRWSASALIRVPVFVFLVFRALLTLSGFGIALLGIISGNVSGSAFILPTYILGVNALLLPIPVFHLVWDNKYRNNWVKFGISTVALVLLIALNFFLNYLWMYQFYLYDLVGVSEWVLF